MPSSGIGAEEAVEQGMRFGVTGEVLVDGDLGEVGAEHVGAGLQHDGDQRNDHLPAIGTQIAQQALHQPAVIRFA